MLKIAKVEPKYFDWHFYSNEISIQNYEQLLAIIVSLYMIITQRPFNIYTPNTFHSNHASFIFQIDIF